MGSFFIAKLFVYTIYFIFVKVFNRMSGLDSVLIERGIGEINLNLKEIELTIIEHALRDGVGAYLNELMRRMHTIKGIAASCGLKKIMRLAHEKERRLRNIDDIHNDPSSIPYASICDDLLHSVYEIRSILGNPDAKFESQESVDAKTSSCYTYVCIVDLSVQTLDLAEIEVLEVFSQFGIEYSDYRSQRCDGGYRVEVDVSQKIQHEELISCMQAKTIILGINQKQENTAVYDTLKTIQEAGTNIDSSSKKAFLTGSERQLMQDESVSSEVTDVFEVQFDNTSKINRNISILINDFMRFEQNLSAVHGVIYQQNTILKNVASQLGILEEGLLAKNLTATSKFLPAQSDFYTDFLQEIRTTIYRNEFTRFNIMQQNLLFISRLKQALVNEQMVDLRSVFQWFGTYIYKVSKELGKQVRYKYEDQSLSIEKQLLSSVSVLLLHCIRNSLDHGIETQETRMKLKKPEEALISIVAEQVSSMVRICITDDGKGLDLGKIKQRGISLNLLDANVDYSDEELIDLIFLPNFSTSKDHTLLSGLGIGLSALREGIQGIGGMVSVSYEKNKFTTFTIVVPSSLNLHDDYIVLDNGFYYAIPASHVKEIQYNDNETPEKYPNLQALFGVETAHSQSNIAVHIKTDIARGSFLVNQLIGLCTVSVFPVLFPVDTLIQALTLTKNGDICFVLHLKKLLAKKEAQTGVKKNILEELGNIPRPATEQLVKESILECTLQSIRIGFPVSLVVETYVLTKLYSIPIALPYTVGIAVIHGQPIPIWDIHGLVTSSQGVYSGHSISDDAKRVNGSSDDTNSKNIIVIQFKDYIIGLLVDEIVGTMKVNQKEFFSSGNTYGIQKTSSLLGVIQQADEQDRPMLLLDPRQCIVSILWRCN